MKVNDFFQTPGYILKALGDKFEFYNQRKK